MTILNKLTKRRKLKLFEKKVHEIYKDLYRFIYSILKNKELTEDVLHDTLIKAYEKFDTLRDIDKFKPWMMSIAKNKSISIINKYKRETPYEDVFIDVISVNEDIPEKILLNDEIKLYIKNSMKFLSPIDREIIQLRYYCDLNFTEIALALNMNVNTIRTKHMRAKMQMQKYLIKELGNEEVAATLYEKEVN